MSFPNLKDAQLQYLTGCFSGHPSDCDIQLWDFAFAGADIDADLLPLHHDFTVPLIDQVAQYVEYAADVLPHPEGETLTAWWIGINDTAYVSTCKISMIAMILTANNISYQIQIAA